MICYFKYYGRYKRFLTLIITYRIILTLSNLWIRLDTDSHTDEEAKLEILKDMFGINFMSLPNPKVVFLTSVFVFFVPRDNGIPGGGFSSMLHCWDVRLSYRVRWKF